MMLAAGVQAELLWLSQRNLLTDASQWAAEVGGLDDQNLARQVATAVGWQLAHEPLTPDPWNYSYQQSRALLALGLQ